MTTIEKLLIQGIRSFSPTSRSIIEFYTPLTLIVGPNGAGKTTIIECLKYASTGELPPDSSRGQAFIHDTKVAGEKEVKAQIKLKFKNVNGKPIVCTRSMQLSQKSTKQEWKTIESALQTYNAQGDAVSQSFRCAELDKEIPELMGVSHAVLQNVIFCHQEEANWPLGDAQSLKKRFDAIFSSTRYTKALEAISKQRKEMAQQVKEHKLKLELCSNNLENATKIRKEVEDTANTVTTIQEDIKKFETDIALKDKAFKELQRLSTAASNIIAEIKKLTHDRDRAAQELSHAESTLQQYFEGTIEELLQKLEDFSQENANLKLQEKDKQVELSGISKQRDQIEKTIRENAEQIGRFKSVQEHMNSIKERRDKLIIEFCSAYKIKEFSAPFTEDKVAQFLKHIEELNQKAETKLNNLKKEFQKLDDARAQAIEEARRTYNDLLDKIKSHERAISDASTEIDKLNLEMKKKKEAHENLGQMESTISAKTKALEKLKDGWNPDALKEKIATLTKKKEEVDTKLTEYSQIVQSMTQFSSAQMLVQQLNSTKSELKNQVESTMSSLGPVFTELIGSLPPDPISASKQVENLLNSLKGEMQKRNKEIEDVAQNYSIYKGQQKSLNLQLSEFESEATSREKRLQTLDPNTPLVQALDDVEKRIDSVKEEIVKLQSAGIIYKNFIKNAQKNTCCPLCESDLTGKLETLIAKLSKTVDKVPESIKRSEKELDDHEKLKKELLVLKPDYEFLQRLKSSQIPEVRQKISEISDKEKKLNDLLSDKLRPELNTLKNKEKKILEILTDVRQAAKTHARLQELATEIKEKEKQLPQKSKSQYDLGTLTEQIKKLQATSNELNTAILSHSAEITEKREKIHRQESDIVSLQKSILELRNLNNDIYTIKQRCDSLQSDVESRREQITELSTNAIIKKNEVDSLIEERNKQKENFTTKDNANQTEKARFVENKLRINSLHEQLQKIELDIKSQDLAHLAEMQKEQMAQSSKLEIEMKSISNELQSLAKQLNSTDIIRRNIEDNVRILQKKQEIAKIDAELATQKRKVDKEFSPNILNETETLKQEITKLKTAKAKLEGSLATLNLSLSKHNQELRSKKYVNVDEEFRLQLITLHTTDIAHKDLEKYAKALDKALMKYHSMKMQEINQIIRELWQSTYKGNDIESIEIRADLSEGTRRTYNYRVVMLKGGIPLDMRGRCSAGQKVLASLIIRLALAETFCINCGILALDEPTTNLDRHNVESFANALVQIIETRKQQRNFQLIVITHDEDFVQLLGRSEHADHYWRVTKDENGHSTIERHQIENL